MNYNTENTMIANNQAEFILPEVTDSVCSTEDFAEDFEGLHFSYPRIKIPAGGSLQFEIPSDDPENPDYAKTIVGVILCNHATCAYWPEGSEYDDNVNPYCFSVDGKTGFGAPGGACADCALNKYGSVENGKGKACKNMRNLYILRSGDFMPVLLALPPTSIRPFTDFMSAAFASRRRPPYSSIVEIGLRRVDNGSNLYSVATFRKVRDFEGEDLLTIQKYALNFREQIKSVNEQRALDASQANGDDFRPLDEGYEAVESEGHFCITGTESVDGTKEELPA